ncbi:MAG TPA: hypothetical protein VH143_31030 [Kofleriaceae bacterium]|nr:hypothetical protein [Kofleriaceae bacterium]
MTIRTIRFHRYGEPADVLQLDRIDAPEPAARRLRAAVHACGLNPADWALCRGMFAGNLPRGIGLDVAGVVDALGDGVTDVANRVLTISDLASSKATGARHSFGESPRLYHDQLGPFVQLAAEGTFAVPIAKTFPLEAWRDAMVESLGGHATAS